MGMIAALGALLGLLASLLLVVAMFEMSPVWAIVSLVFWSWVLWRVVRHVGRWLGATSRQEIDAWK